MMTRSVISLICLALAQSLYAAEQPNGISK